MNVAVVGNGNREKAMKSVIEPSAGSSRVNSCVLVPWTTIDEVVAQVLDTADLVTIGPEAPLVAGLADKLHSLGIPTVGPTAAAAKLEGSKVFGRKICKEAIVRTPRYWRIDSERDAEALLANWEGPIVVKWDGLWGGKGVTIHHSAREALAKVSEGLPHGPVLIEEFLVGQEISVFFACDGVNGRFVGDACDKKKLLENDEGPNTGGMGAWSPSSYLTSHLLEEIQGDIVEPVLQVMKQRGVPYHGILYLGLMLVNVGGTILIYLIEFNCRWGDPEAQVILPRLKTNFVNILTATLETGGLESLPPIEFYSTKLVGVTIAGKDYPKKGSRLRTVVGSGKTYRAAHLDAYGQIEEMKDSGVLVVQDIQYRTDIGVGIV
ncbi:hypothetical protein A3D09_04315 [Candidatus Collierbacteria bacterium RIFCSPHIGHO2_02_FULL_49_10]|uniref:ATP-grasp domain-containing protein n=2 Tax=Patescibacteria group TaxID=1783273 RepID=A0A1F4XSK3_9BACT|nr:MAG: hypothetical protein A3F55_02355 [Candidatus Adlerbacteria bacterium RIFCSPHIGHO2_12_FULL_53_18]OGD70232.1 MAG: hypothetical protein A3D09_04315 [Candidatus Collierbacteria bacterium RIFCSPHIGHO2_02_FULL_49_10]